MKTKATCLLIVIAFCVTALNGQIVWDNTMDVADASYGNFYPRMVTDASGNPLVIWGNASKLYFSRWNGNAFTTPMQINPSNVDIATANWMGPDIASKGDTIYIVYKQTPESSISSHIWIVSSFDGGQTFSNQVQVDNIADSLSRFAVVSIDDTGNPVVGFMKFDPSFINPRWVVSRSNDYGNTFSPDTKASGWSGPTSEVCDCCPGAIKASGNKVAMIYRDNDNDIRDNWVGISVDGGASFTAGMNVDQQNWYLLSCPASGPDGIIIGDSVYTVTMNGASGMPRVYFNASSLTNVSSSSGNLLTGNLQGLQQQNYPRIDHWGNEAAVVWKQVVSGQMQLPISYTNDITSGFTTNFDTVALENITNADVALYDGNIYVVWEDDFSGTVKFRHGLYLISGEENALQTERSPIELFPNPCDNKINIRLPVAYSRIRIFNELGNLVIKKTIVSNKETIHLNLPGGVYYYIISNYADYTASGKLVVL